MPLFGSDATLGIVYSVGVTASQGLMRETRPDFRTRPLLVLVSGPDAVRFQHDGIDHDSLLWMLLISCISIFVKHQGFHAETAARTVGGGLSLLLPSLRRLCFERDRKLGFALHSHGDRQTRIAHLEERGESPARGVDELVDDLDFGG